MHFIVDGYNLINKIAEFKDLSFEDKRTSLLNLLQDFKSKISLKNKITVVFDGKTGVYFPENLRTDLKVLFSKDEEADLLIERIVDKTKNPNSLVVITDDKAIIGYVKAKRAKHKPTSQFLKDVDKKIKKQKLEDNFKLSFKEAYKINKELKELWRKKYL